MSIRKDVHIVTRSLAMKLRVLRAERQLSLRKASEVTGVDKVSLSRFERGLTHPQDRTLAKIAEGYGIPVEELMEEPALLGKAEASPSPEPVEEADEWRRVIEQANKELAYKVPYWTRAERGSLTERAKEHLRAYPYPWMSDTLAETIARWSDASLAQNDPKYSHIIAVACFDVLGSVLKYDVPGKMLKDRVPEHEVEDRMKLADWLYEIAHRAQDHYVDSNEAEAAKVKDLEERSENVERLMKDTA